MTFRPTRHRELLINAVPISIIVAVLSLATGNASAQTVGGQPGTSLPTLVQSDPSPFSVGGLMFFFVTAVVMIGAVVLYLRNRQRP